MSDSTSAPSTPAEPATPAPRRNTGVIVRVAVRGVVAVLVVLGYLELRARRGFSATAEAWETAQSQAAVAGKQLRKNDLVAQQSGNPRIIVDPSVKPRLGEGGYVETFRWSGILRNYDIQVHYDAAGESPVVLYTHSVDPNADDAPPQLTPRPARPSRSDDGQLDGAESTTNTDEPAPESAAPTND